MLFLVVSNFLIDHSQIILFFLLKLTILISIFKITSLKDSSVLGKHAVLDDILHCSVIDDSIPPECQMHLILDQSNIDCTLHCISIQFPEQDSEIEANAKRNATKLYRDCIERTRKGGFECTRNNSSGPVRFNNIFWKWFSYKGRFPRKRQGVVCVKSFDGKKIHTLYINIINITHTAKN